MDLNLNGRISFKILHCALNSNVCIVFDFSVNSHHQGKEEEDSEFGIQNQFWFQLKLSCIFTNANWCRQQMLCVLSKELIISNLWFSKELLLHTRAFCWIYSVPNINSPFLKKVYYLNVSFFQENVNTDWKIKPILLVLACFMLNRKML